MTILDQIVAHKKEEVACRKKQKPLASLLAEISEVGENRSLKTILATQPGFHFICEIKKASPSRGVIQPDFDPASQARKYAAGGASAISVLTDERFFQGSSEYLKLVQKMVPLPILRKDFIIDPYQIYESKAMAADVILLIARILSGEQIKEFGNLAIDLKLDVLLEIAKPADVDKISNFENKIVGINNRDLKTFQVDLNNSLRIKPLLAENVPVISESGISKPEDILLLAKHGFRGVLIGETLMKAGDPQNVLQTWKNEVANVYAS